MQNYLLIDFGASRIKAAHLIQDEIKNIRDYPSINPCNAKNKRFEVSGLEIKNKFIEICKEYYNTFPYDGILICSEMHGFLAVDENNNATSNYVSWKSERSMYGEEQTFSKLKSVIDTEFLKKTGLNTRACYPIFNLYDMAEHNEFVGGKILSLPEWLCCADNKSLNKAHVTMSAGLGFYNIYENDFDKDLVGLIKKPINFNKVVKDVEVGGYININKNEIPIYTGVGDFQCAVLGAGNNDSTIAVNLGTGSQVGMINLDNDFCEKRPYFADSTLSVITHIPSGRMLSCYINFLKTINSQTDFWHELSEITAEDLEASDLNMNLCIFSSAWNYIDGGAIESIKEGNWTKKNYLASLLKNYIMQYKNAISELNPEKNRRKIILSGGIPGKLPIIQKYLEKITGYDVIYNKPQFDETLLGLKIISKYYIKRADAVQKEYSNNIDNRIDLESGNSKL